mgnify:CR=1 FL=1
MQRYWFWAAFALDRMQQITNYEQFKIDIQPYKKLFATTALKQAYQKKEDELTVYAKGSPSLQFFTEVDTKDQNLFIIRFQREGSCAGYMGNVVCSLPGGKPFVPKK